MLTILVFVGTGQKGLDWALSHPVQWHLILSVVPAGAVSRLINKLRIAVPWDHHHRNN